MGDKRERTAYRDAVRYRAIIERSESKPNQLTIYAASEGDAAATRWVTAAKGSYVDLSLMR